MKAALFLSAIALLLWLTGNWMGREAQSRYFDIETGWRLAAVIAYFLSTAFGLVAVLRMLA